MVIHAAHRWAGGKKNVHGYQRATLAMPDSSRKTAPPTRGRSASRSRAWATERTGGHSTSLGATTQSLASSSGTVAKPVDDVDALGDPVEPGGPRRQRRATSGSCWSRWEYAPVSEHSGEGDAERHAEAGGDALVVQRAREARLDPRGRSLRGGDHGRDRPAEPAVAGRARTRPGRGRRSTRRRRPCVGAHDRPREPGPGVAHRPRPAR